MSARRFVTPSLYFVLVLAVAACEPDEAKDFVMRPLPDAQIGERYEAPLTSASGHFIDRWASPGLGSEVAPGVVHAEPGTLSGTPSEAGTFFVHYNVEGEKEKASFGESDRWFATGITQLTVKGEPLEITTDTPAGATVGMSYDQDLAATGGVAPYTWSVQENTLPPGLWLSDGAITGTPTAPGTYDVVVSVSSRDEQEISATIKIVVDQGLRITTESLPAATRGEEYSSVLEAAGGTSEKTWDGTAPPGLEITPDGSIVGTPVEAAPDGYSLLVEVQSGEQSASRLLELVVNHPPLRIVTQELPDVSAGDAYSEQLQASGGGGGYVWALQSGSPPPGLALSSDGHLSGTPTEATPSSGASFQVQVESQDGSRTSRAYTIVVHEDLRITTESLPTATRGEEYSSVLEAAGGTSERIWDGTAPPGLEITPDGSIVGIPEEAAPDGRSVLVEVQSGEQSASRLLELVVNHPPLQIVTEELPDASEGESYSEQLQAEGGDGEYVWNITVARLPAGLDLLPDGEIEGIPAEGGDFNFSVRVVSGDGQEAVKGLALTVEADHPVLEITGSVFLASGVEGEPYADQLTATGGDGHYTWSHESGTLPPGVTVAPDGSVSGTPGATGGFDATIGVTSGDGQFESEVFSIVVYADLTVTTAADLGCTEEGQAYSQQLSADGGDHVYGWALTGGSLPPGLSLAADGEISGTPTDHGTVSFDAEVTSGDGQTAVRSFTLEVAEAGVGCS